jgi:hypothetical protein
MKTVAISRTGGKQTGSSSVLSPEALSLIRWHQTAGLPAAVAARRA